MEIKIEKEPIFLSEVIFDGQTEQGVELDYILPDYYPDIFKILKCSLTPGIISYNISGTQLYCDGVVYIKVLYASENNSAINCVEQRYTYSKTIELSKPAEKATVRISPKVDYVNCRAISGRRIDIRGAVSCKVKAVSSRKSEIISNAENLEIKKTPILYCGDKLSANRQFVVREDIETGSGGISSVIYCDAYAETTETKIISDKVIVKGEAKVKALYLIKKDGEDYTEVMDATVPLSQIIDLSGVSDSHSCSTNMRIMDCSLELKADENGEIRMFGCDMTVDCTVTAIIESTLAVLNDVYSTEFDIEYTKAPMKVEYAPQNMKKQLSLKTNLECGEGSLSEIYDCRCDISNIICRRNTENELIVVGQCSVQAIGKLSNGNTVCLDKNQPFEIVAETAVFTENSEIDPYITITDTSFSIVGENTIDVRVSMSVEGMLYQTRTVDVIKDIIVFTDKPKHKDTDYALKMYYADENEEIWSIAKRFNTSLQAIMFENDLDCEKLTAPCMLLIPIV